MAFSTSELIPNGIKGVTKALTAGAVAAAGVFIDAIADGSVTTAEWKTIGVAAVTAAVGAYFFPNSFKGFKDQGRAVQVANTPANPS